MVKIFTAFWCVLLFSCVAHSAEDELICKRQGGSHTSDGKVIYKRQGGSHTRSLDHEYDSIEEFKKAQEKERIEQEKKNQKERAKRIEQEKRTERKLKFYQDGMKAFIQGNHHQSLALFKESVDNGLEDAYLKDTFLKMLVSAYILNDTSQIALYEEKCRPYFSDITRLKDLAESIKGGRHPKYKSVKNNMGMAFVYIPPGIFMMGSPENEPLRHDAESLHMVTLTKGFYLQTTEVTQAQWKAVMGNNPSYFQNCGENGPVVSVSWDEVQEFTKKLNQMYGVNHYRLPTEAEWEYAARAGTVGPFAYGDRLTSDQANYDYVLSSPNRHSGISPKGPVTVAGFPPNPWGLYDMHGNVWEWCHDLYEEYPSGPPVVDPEGPSSSYGWGRVIRGGCWCNKASDCRSASRLWCDPKDRNRSIGFRLVMMADKE